MATSAYIGLVGSGKSYTVVQSAIIPALSEGRKVLTNIKMNKAELLDAGIKLPIQFETQAALDDPYFFDNEEFYGALVVIDECQKLWPSGLRSDKANPSHISFFTEHRHRVGVDGRSIEIIVVTQRLSLIAGFIRANIEKTFVAVNLAIVSKPKSYRLDLYVGAVKDTPNKRDVVNEYFGTYDPEIYKFYVSHTASKFGAGDESRIDNRISIFSRRRLMIYGVSIGGLLLAGVYGLAHLYGAIFEEVVEAPIVAEKQIILEKEIKQTVPKIPPHEGLLSQISSINIDFNQGVFPRIKYRFQVDFIGGSASLKGSDLSRIGYRVKAITPCLARIQAKNFELIVSCKADDLIENPLLAVTDNLPSL